MLDNIIDKNIIFLQRYGVKMDTDDDRAIYKYGLQILYYYIIDLVVIFALAHLFGRLYETVIMIFIFGWFQVFGGGYHAKTPSRCLLTIIIWMVLGNILITLMIDMTVINILLIFTLSIAILNSPPVINKNHPIKKKIIRRSKLIICISVILILNTVFVLWYFNNTTEITIIAVTLLLYLFSLIRSKRK